jgi:hypothetical protein
MSFQDWQKNGWIRPHRTSPEEVAGLLAVIDRDVAASANEHVDADWRFAIAYNAALQLAALALKACGFEVPKGGGAHQRTIESLRLTLVDDGTIVDALQGYRARRGGGIYETTGIASDAEIAELRTLAIQLRDRVRSWLKKEHPGLLAKRGSASGKPGKRR